MSSFLPVPNPIAFRVFGLEIRWYAICIVAGMIAAVILCMKRTPLYGIDPADKVLDMVLWVIPIGIIGARLYYCIFEWENYKDDLISILYIHKGGLAIHGGLIFGLATLAIVAKKWGHGVLKWMDLVAPGIALGQAIGRWGNYFNSEAHGTPTTLPWAIEVDGQLVHPTFLYESIWCLLLCIFLVIFEKKRKKRFDGQIICLYVILYSVERYFVESLRTDSLWIGPLRQAQVISICAFVLGIVFYILLARKDRKAQLLSAQEKQPEEEIDYTDISDIVGKDDE